MQNQENEPDVISICGSKALFIAAKHNNKEVFEQYLEERDNANNSDVDGVSPLLISLKEGNFDITELRLLAGFRN